MAKTKPSKIQQVRREVINLMDRLTEPREMSKAEALETLEELWADVESRVEALKEEIKNEEG